MANKPNNFQDIHVEDYLSDYENIQITSDSLMFDWGREKISLNGEWNYTVDQYDTCLRQKWFNENYFDAQGNSLPVDFSFDSWPTMKLPCNWNTFLPEYLLYEGVMTFTRKFEFDLAQLSGKKVFLKIGAVNYTARLFLNKSYIGMHRGGSTPFYIDETNLLKTENRLIIVADSSRRPEQVPTENTDWFNYGGVYRDIELIAVPQVFIKNFSIGLKKDDSYKNVQVKVELSDKVDGLAVVNIPELGITENVQIAGGQGELNFQVENLILWDTENPKLYKVHLSFGEDSLCDDIGFRQISVSDKKIFLNGKQIFLKGISCHEESVPNGKSLSDAEGINSA